MQDGSPATMDCECMQKRKSVKRIKQSGLGNLLDKRVNDYVAIEDWQKEVKEKATRYLTEKSKNWFVILGQSGSGKTHICSAIGSRLLNQGKEVRYMAWTDLAAKIREMDEVNAEIEKIKDIEVLYIDDLFKIAASQGQKNVAFNILSYRANNELTTIISSEVLFDDLLKVDEAIAGRIKEMAQDYLINITNGDKNYRLKME